MTQTLRHLALLVAVSAIVFFVNLGGPRLWDRDEPRNAGCARDMLARGDLVVPMFNAELREHKPVLTYWAMMASFAVFDDPEFAPRAASAAAGVLTVVLVYFAARRLFDADAGLWAGLALATALLFGISSRAATHDAVLTLCTTAAMLAYVLVAFAPKPGAAGDELILTASEPSGRYWPRAWAAVLPLHAAMGLVTLAKGPVPWVVATAAIGMFLLVANLPPAPSASGGGVVARLGRMLRPFNPLHVLRTAWMMRPLTAIAVVLLIAGPWFYLVHVRTGGAFTEGFFIGHNIRRAATAMEGHGVGSLWLYPLEFLAYYPAVIVGGFFPWTVMVGAIVVAVAHWLRRRDPWAVGLVFALCWVGVWVVAFSLPRTKLPTYAMPAFPAVAMIVGAYVSRWVRGGEFPGAIEPRPVFGLLLGIGVVAAVVLSVFGERLMSGVRPLGLLGLIPALGAAACLWLATRGNRRGAAGAFAVTAAAFAVAALAGGAQVVSAQQRNEALLAAVRANAADPRVASFGRLEPTWVYYLGRPIREIPHDDESPAAGVAASNQFLGDPGTFLITTRDRAALLTPGLPAGVVELARVPYFSRIDEDLVVMGRPATGTQ